jgi:hypothetical protein
MTALSRRFLVALGLLMAIVTGILFYASTLKPYAATAANHAINLPGLALSVAWHEPRSLLETDDSDAIYWDLPLPKRMEFVYAP